MTRTKKIHGAFAFAIAVRLAGVLFLPQTYFQADEYYQALEPAHHLVFGYGFLSWEWRDLPAVLGQASGSSSAWWDEVVVQGRMRSWLWPSVFAAVYKVLQILGLDSTALLVLAPRFVGAIVAASTDYATYRLATKVLGHGAGETALFLSLTSLFNAHVLSRVLSTSPETLLVTLALQYFPLPKPKRPEPQPTLKEKAEGDRSHSRSPSDLDLGAQDRAGPDPTPDGIVRDSLPMAAAFASLAVCLRPTTLPLWAYLGVEHTLRLIQRNRFAVAVKDVLGAVLIATGVVAGSTTLDYAMTGRLMVPFLTFVHRNIFMDIASFYGKTSPLYHLTQTLPILLFPVWYWWGQGFIAAILPKSMLSTKLAGLDRPAPLRLLARAVAFAILCLSLSPHSEWRFLHPFLPTLLLFTIPPLFKAYRPVVPLGSSTILLRQYFRLNKLPFYLLILAGAIPMAYLGIFHGRAQVEVMNVLRTGQAGRVTGLVALMPCHSTPWMSHLHKDIPAWFLTCEPPLHGDISSHVTETRLFCDAPVTYLEKVFPYPAKPLQAIPDHAGDHTLPSHIILFGELLGHVEGKGARGNVTVKEALEHKGYSEVWSGWNGFDWAQEESDKRGHVKIYALSPV